MLIAIIPRALPWARSFCPFRACCLRLACVLLLELLPFQGVLLLELLGFQGVLLLELLPFTFALPFGQRFSIPFGR